MKVNAITTTIIFDAFALNKDENLARNVLSIKTLKRKDRVLSFMSKYAMRHYLLETLKEGSNWKIADVTTCKSKSGKDEAVLQFDLTKYDIINSEELDAFGYMFTIGGQGAITRKATLHITKAISLEPYKGDTILYANHELVQRGIRQGLNATPDIFYEQEHNSLFKASFTIDCKRLGIDEWFFDSYDEKKKIGIIKPKKEGKGQEFTKDFSNYPSELISTEKVCNKVKVIFKIPPEKKKERILQILNAIKDGFYSYAGESNTIVPLFMIASGVKVPSPIFFPYLDVDMQQVIGIKDCLANGWIDTKVFIYASGKLKVKPEDITQNVTKDWNEFIKELELL